MSEHKTPTSSSETPGTEKDTSAQQRDHRKIPSPQAVLLRAAVFAADKHKTQRRKDKDATPYIGHPIQVASLLAEAGVTDTDVLVAALLHDTVEDTKTSLDEIRQLFGTRVAEIVAACTDDKSLSKVQRKQVQLAKTASAPIEAKWVKLADKYANASDLFAHPPASWSQAERDGCIAWTCAVFRQLEGISDYFDAKFHTLFDAAALSRSQVDDVALTAKVDRYYGNIESSD